ncbi:MAG: SCO family protein [Pyrinomonadaceae bacterium]
MKRSSAKQNKSKLKLFATITFLLISATVTFAQRIEHYNSPLYSPKTYDPTQNTANGIPQQLKKVGIDQNLNGQLPLDAVFKDENGNEVKFGKYFNQGKPVILALVYYECPMLCNEVLNGLTGALKGISFVPGKDFEVVAISFDARENDKPNLAANKKKSYLEKYGKPETANGWHFLTGTQPEIDKVAKAAGFKYAFDTKTNQFAHAGGIMIATPTGRLSRYFYGIDYAPKEVKFGIMESAQNKIGNPVEQLYLYCFHYDPATGKYGLAIMNVLRIAGVLTLALMGALIFGFWRKNKKSTEANGFE